MTAPIEIWRKRFGNLLQQSVINRYSYEKFGNRGYVRLLHSPCTAPDSRDWLRRYYGSGR